MLAVSTAHGCCLMWSCNKWIGTAGRPYKEYRDLLLDFMKRHSKSHTFSGNYTEPVFEIPMIFECNNCPQLCTVRAHFPKLWYSYKCRVGRPGKWHLDMLFCYMVWWPAFSETTRFTRFFARERYQLAVSQCVIFLRHDWARRDISWGAVSPCSPWSPPLGPFLVGARPWLYTANDATHARLTA